MNFAVEKVDFSLFAAEQLQKHFIQFSVDLTPVVQQLSRKDAEIDKLVYSGTFADKRWNRKLWKLALQNAVVAIIGNSKWKKLGVSQMTLTCGAL